MGLEKNLNAPFVGGGGGAIKLRGLERKGV
jgi:hypothetical protein